MKTISELRANMQGVHVKPWPTLKIRKYWDYFKKKEEKKKTIKKQQVILTTLQLRENLDPRRPQSRQRARAAAAAGYYARWGANEWECRKLLFLQLLLFFLKCEIKTEKRLSKCILSFLFLLTCVTLNIMYNEYTMN